MKSKEANLALCFFIYMYCTKFNLGSALTTCVAAFSIIIKLIFKLYILYTLYSNHDMKILQLSNKTKIQTFSNNMFITRILNIVHYICQYMYNVYICWLITQLSHIIDNWMYQTMNQGFYSYSTIVLQSF